MMPKQLVIYLLCALLPHWMAAQNCEEKLEIALQSKAAGKYELAIKQFQAAAGDCDKIKSGDIEKAIIEIFLEIDGLKRKAEADRLAAVKAQKEADRLRLIAESEKQKADSLRKVANLALDSVQVLIEKGRQLENTFADSSTYKYLYATGIHHFKYDTLEQSRDYQNALTYFALARFLKPGDTLTCLVRTAQKGIVAENAFHAGDLDKARFEYDSIRILLQTIHASTDFEEQRLRQIQEVERLFGQLVITTRTNATKLVLEGDWWTLPRAFARFNKATNIVFNKNHYNFVQLPAVLDSFSQLTSMSFTHCVNIRALNDWTHSPHLTQLIVQHNPNLYSISRLEALPGLRHLAIENCPALTLVEGCRHLEYFSTEKSMQLRVAKILNENTGLKVLILADLLNDTLQIENLPDLEALTLARLKANTLDGLHKNPKLQKLVIDQLGQLTTFVPPVQLTSIKINNCDNLKDIRNWAPSPHLNRLVLYDNNTLEKMPDWRDFPNLKSVLIQNDTEVKRVKGTKLLREAEEIYIINNPNIITNSIHAGFGFEWGVNVSSAKIEFEHRRRVRFLGGNPDLGFKALAGYAYKRFDYATGAPVRTSDGYFAGGVITYYSPLWVYTGGGMALGNIRNRFSDNTSFQSTNLIWINTLGAQLAPRFLRKDKVSINMDLYTVFVKKDYYILPSFGLTYYHTLGMHRKTHFLRPGDARRTVKYMSKQEQLNTEKSEKRKKLQDLPGKF